MSEPHSERLVAVFSAGSSEVGVAVVSDLERFTNMKMKRVGSGRPVVGFAPEDTDQRGERRGAFAGLRWAMI